MPRKPPSALGANLKSIRESRGYTLREFSRRSGVDISALSRLETGKTQSAHTKTLLGIAAGLDVSVGDLFTAED